MRPKDLRIRFLPVNVCAIMAPLGTRGQAPRIDQSSSVASTLDRSAGPKLAWPPAGRRKYRSWDGSGGPFVLVGGQVTSASGRNDETRRSSKGAPADSCGLWV